MQINNVTFEIDSKRVVDSYHSDKRDGSDHKAIIRECCNTFSAFFTTNAKVEFIRRQVNEVSCSLVRLGWLHLMLVTVFSLVNLIVSKILV